MYACLICKRQPTAPEHPRPDPLETMLLGSKVGLGKNGGQSVHLWRANRKAAAQ